MDTALVVLPQALMNCEPDHVGGRCLTPEQSRAAKRCKGVLARSITWAAMRGIAMMTVGDGGDRG